MITAHLFEIGYAAWGCASTVTATVQQCRGWLARTFRLLDPGYVGYVGYAGLETEGKTSFYTNSVLPSFLKARNSRNPRNRPLQEWRRRIAKNLSIQLGFRCTTHARAKGPRNHDAQ